MNLPNNDSGQEERFSAEEVESLWRIAWAADRGSRAWSWHPSHNPARPGVQTVDREGDACLIANCYDEPDERMCTAEYIAAFDPPTVLRLLKEVVPYG
jgi:hypothetical protein